MNATRTHSSRRRLHLTALFVLLAAALAWPVHPAQAQSSDQTGTEFYLAIPTQGEKQYDFDPDEQFYLYMVATTEAVVTISIADDSFASFTETLTANVPATVQIPNASPTDGVHTHAAAEGVSSKGIHVESTAPIVLYVMSHVDFSVDGALALPAAAAGTYYVVSSYQSAWKDAFYLIVAQQDGTTVEIAETKEYSVPGGDNSELDSLWLSDPEETAEEVTEMESVTLDTGEVYFATFPFGVDPSGSLIRSDKPVVVYSGAQLSNVPLNYLAADLLLEAVPPVATWGSEFIVPTNAGRAAGDTIRVYGWAADTVVSFNGTEVATLAAGQWLESRSASTEPIHVTSSSPVMVVRYFNGTNWDSTTGDPSMLVVPPTEQYIGDFSFTTPVGFSPEYTSYLSLTAPTGASVIVGSTAVTGWQTVGSSGFATAEVALEPGAHSVTTDAPIQAAVYGVRTDESFAFQAGQDYTPTWEPTWQFAESEEEAAARPLRCATVPDMAVNPQFIELAPGGTARIEISLRNLCRDRHFDGADLLLSLSDGLTIIDGNGGYLNLGGRAAWQALYLAPGETATYYVIVQAPAGAISNPLHVSELYYLGRVATRIDGVFIAPAVTADEVGTPSEPAAPAAAAAPAPLPAVLPNTAGELQLPAALGSAVAAILLAAFALSARRRVS